MLLNFNKPKKLRSTDEHNKTYQSDSGISGTYVENMDNASRQKWKAKHITGKAERVEIRKSMKWINLVIIVYKNTDVKMSTNGKLEMTLQEFRNIQIAIDEALNLMNGLDNRIYIDRESIIHIKPGKLITLLELHRYLQGLSDNAPTENSVVDIISPNPSIRMTDNILKLINGVTVHPESTQYLTGGTLHQGDGEIYTCEIGWRLK